MINEAAAVFDNAEKADSIGVPTQPLLLFISDGSGGTGFDKDTWQKIPVDYISQKDNAEYILLECPHYVHDYEYELIGSEIKAFLSEYRA